MATPTTLLDLAERGPYAAGLRELEVADPADPARRLPVDVWYPARPEDGLEAGAEHPFGQPHAAVPNAPPAPGVFALVAFSHGNSGLRRQSTFLTTHLASHGFVVVAPDHVGNTFFEMLELDEEQRRDVHFAARRSRPRDLVAAIDAALVAPGVAAVDPERIYALGHSYGGWTAFKMPGVDPRVRAVCGLAPASEPFVGRKAFAPGELPLPDGVASLVVAGTDDVLVDLESSVLPLARRLAPPTRLLAIDEVDHFHFCDGVKLLHVIHEQNRRPRQTRAARPLADLLPQDRIHRILCGAVTTFFASLAPPGPPFAGLEPDALAALDRAVRALG